MLNPGAHIGPYAVEAEIGVGATSLVYRVRNEQLDVVFALKLLSLSHPEVHRRMLQEGRVQAALRHPNIVRVFEVLDVDGQPGLVMDYVDGPNLEMWLKEHPDIAPAQRDELACQIVEGVAHAHARGLIHRDLKPANVLMESDAAQVSPRITDFGLAKILDGAPQVGDTRTGHALGTPRYMAPEQIRSAKHVDTRADVFSLGCLLFEIYCGRRAFPQEDMLSVFNAVTDGEIDDPEKVADVPKPIARAIRAALQMDPDDRPADAGALLDLLKAARGSEAGLAPVPLPQPSRARNALRATLAIGVGLTVGIGATVPLFLLAAAIVVAWRTPSAPVAVPGTPMEQPAPDPPATPPE